MSKKHHHTNNQERQGVEANGASPEVETITDLEPITQAEPTEAAAPAPAEAAQAASRPQEAEGGREGPSSEAQLRDQVLRLAADFDNYRKRMSRELDEMRRFGIEKLVLDLVPILDNLQRALDHAGEDKSALVQGVRMVANLFLEVLGRYGVRTFTSVGAPFDPERHEAVSQIATADHAPGTIVEELQRGYTLYDRLLRPAQVVVATALTQSEDAPVANSDGAS